MTNLNLKSKKNNMATEIIRVPKYNWEIEVKFYPNSHKYKIEWSNDWLLSVSAITGIVDKPQLKQWAVNCACNWLLKQNKIGESEIEHIRKFWSEESDQALETGKQLHTYLENFVNYKINNGEKPSFPEDDKARRSVGAFLNWYTQDNVQFIASEMFVYSRNHNYVGTLDILYRKNGKLYLADWKTSKDIYPDYINQVVGYAIAYEEEFNEKVDCLAINRFDKDTGEFDSFEIERGSDVYEKARECFLNCLSLKRTNSEFAKLLSAR